MDQLVKVAEIYQMETVLQIMRLFERCDINITPAQAEFMWSVCSDEVFASWLCNEDDEHTWKMILIEMITNHKIQEIINF